MTSLPRAFLAELKANRFLFVGALVSAIASALLCPPFVRGGGEMVAVAQRLAHSGEFADPFVQTIPTGPTAIIPPLHPWIMAAGIVVLGDRGCWFFLAVSAIVVQALQAALLPRASLTLLGDRRPGIYGAALCILLPVYQWMPYWDAVYTGCSLLLFCLASEYILVNPPAPLYRRLLLGVAAGLLLLLNTSSAIVIGIWILCELRRKRIPFQAALRSTLAFSLGAALTILPWSLRNYARLGTFAIKDNFGMTFYASNNDSARASFASGMRDGTHKLHYPAGSMAEAEFFKRVGEPNYDRYRTREALRWIGSHTGAFLRLTAARIVQFWFPDPLAGRFVYGIWIVTALSVPGAILLFRRARAQAALPGADAPAAAWFLGLVWLVYPLMYYVVVSDPRYRYPVLWLSLLAAGYGLHQFAQSRMFSALRFSR